MRHHLTVRTSLVVAGCMILLGGVGYISWLEYQRAWLADSVARFITPTIQVGDAMYRTDAQGRVRTAAGAQATGANEREALRLAQYATAARVNPIMGFADADLDQWQRAEQEMRGMRDTLANYYSGADRDRVRDHLQPIRVVTAYRKAEQARRALVATATPARAETYHERLLRGIAAATTYARELQTLYAALSERSNENTPNTFTMMGGETSYSTMDTALDTAIRQLKAARERASRRWSCRNGYVWACQNLSAHLEEMVPNEPLRLTEIQPSETQRRNRDVLQVLYDTPETSHVPNMAPTFALSSDRARCYRDQGEWLLYQPRQEWTGDTTIDYFALMNVIILHDTRGSDDPYIAMLGEANQRFFHQAALNMYACLGVPTDAATLHTLQDIYTAVSQVPSEYPYMTNVLGRGNSIRSMQVVTDAAIQSYLARLGAVMQENGQHGLRQTYNTEAALHAEHMLTRHHQRSSSYAQLLLSAVEHRRSLIAIFETGANIPTEYLLIARSYPALFLATFNRSGFPEGVVFMETSEHNLAPFQTTYAAASEEVSPSRLTEMLLRGAAYETRRLRELRLEATAE